MHSNNNGVDEKNVRHLNGQSRKMVSGPSNLLRSLKRPGFVRFRVCLLACLLAVSIAGAQSSHDGFKVETLDLSGAGINLKSDMGVNGLDFLSDGRMAVATWGGDKAKSPKRGKVYVLSGVLEGGPIKAKQLAEGMNDNGGLVVVNDTIYVSNKDGIFWIDPNGTSTAPTRLAPVPWSGNYHEYHSTPVHKDGYLYSIVHQPYFGKGYKSWKPLPERGSYMKVNRITGEKTFLAGGLREPNGGNIGPEGDFFVGDNQGHWVSSSKLVHVDSGDFFGFDNTEGPFNKPTLEQKPPAIWFEHKNNGTSPDQPILLHKGPYKNQMLIGDHYHCNLQRLFLEKVGGEWQGACFPMLNKDSFSSSPNRLVWGPDSNTIYVGGMGAVRAWPCACGGNRTIMKLTLTGKTEFEILAMRSVANGFELEFTDTPGPSAMAKGNYSFKRWSHQPQWGYHSGRHQGEGGVSIQSVEKSDREKSVTLVVGQGDLKHKQGNGFIQSTIFKLSIKGVKSEGGRDLHTKTAWYTLNKIGPGRDPVDINVLRQQQRNKNLPLFVNHGTLYLRGTGELRAKIRTLDGRVLVKVHATGPAVLPLGPLPIGMHFLTGTLDGVPFTKKVVAAN